MTRMRREDEPRFANPAALGLEWLVTSVCVADA